MKYLVLFAVLAIAYLLWRNARLERKAPPPAAPAPPPPAEPQAMVRCAACAVHLPHSDAVAGAGGELYCSQEHRLRGDSGS